MQLADPASDPVSFVEFQAKPRRSADGSHNLRTCDASIAGRLLDRYQPEAVILVTGAT